MQVPPSIREFSWEELHNLSKELASIIAKNVPKIDVVLGIARGGCFPALTLCYLLKVRTLGTIQVATTLDETPRGTRRNPTVILAPDPALIKGKICLLVDDVTNTGATLSKAVDVVQQCQPRRIVTAALVWDTVSTPHGTRVEKCRASYVATQIDAWAGFPWEEI